MLSNYAKNKEHIFKWRDANRDKYNEIHNEWQHKHADVINLKRMRKYYFDKECARLRNILLD